MAIAITIKPQHLCNICKGIKEGELRKNESLHTAVEKEIVKKGKATIYCICSKNEWYLIRDNRCDDYYICHKNRLCEMDITDTILNGKVVCKFECEKVDLIKQCGIYKDKIDGLVYPYHPALWFGEICLTQKEVDKYLGFRDGYLIHISNLKIFEKPKEIKNLYKLGAWKVFEEQFDSSYLKKEQQEIMEELGQTITKAPQNFCYVEDDYGF